MNSSLRRQRVHCARFSAARSFSRPRRSALKALLQLLNLQLVREQFLVVLSLLLVVRLQCLGVSAEFWPRPESRPAIGRARPTLCDASVARAFAAFSSLSARLSATPSASTSVTSVSMAARIETVTLSSCLHSSRSASTSFCRATAPLAACAGSGMASWGEAGGACAPSVSNKVEDVLQSAATRLAVSGGTCGAALACTGCSTPPWRGPPTSAELLGSIGEERSGSGRP